MSLETQLVELGVLVVKSHCLNVFVSTRFADIKTFGKQESIQLKSDRNDDNSSTEALLSKIAVKELNNESFYTYIFITSFLL